MEEGDDPFTVVRGLVMGDSVKFVDTRGKDVVFYGPHKDGKPNGFGVGYATTEDDTKFFYFGVYRGDYI